MRHKVKIQLTLEVNDPYRTGIPQDALDEIRKNAYEALLRRWGSLTALSPFPFGIADIQLGPAVIEQEHTGIEVTPGVSWRTQLVVDGEHGTDLATSMTELGAVITFDLAKKMWKGRKLRLVKVVESKELTYDGMS